MFAWVAMEIVCLGGLVEDVPGHGRWEEFTTGVWSVDAREHFALVWGIFEDSATEWDSMLYFCM